VKIQSVTDPSALLTTCYSCERPVWACCPW